MDLKKIEMGKSMDDLSWYTSKLLELDGRQYSMRSLKSMIKFLQPLSELELAWVKQWIISEIMYRENGHGETTQNLDEEKGSSI